MAKTMKPSSPKSNDKNQGKGLNSPVMDVEESLQRLGQDEELFAEIAQIYLEDSPAMLQSIHDAASQADAKSLQRAAHSLKGLTATLSAQPVASASYHLEQMGATGNFTDAAAAVTQLNERVDELNIAVRDYLERR